MTTKTKKSGSKPGAKKQAERKFPLLAVGFGVVAIALIAAIVFSSEEPIGSGGQFGEPEIEGTALPPAPQSNAAVAEDPAIGRVAPEVTGVDFDDNAVSISHDGTPKAVVFVAHWCPHCQDEVPRVQNWLDSGGGVDGVEIVTVSTFATSGRSNWPPSSWLDREGWTSATIRDDSDSSTMISYGGSAVPYWVFLNGDGTVAFRASGGLPVDVLEAAMQEIAPAS